MLSNIKIVRTDSITMVVEWLFTVWAVVVTKLCDWGLVPLNRQFIISMKITLWFINYKHFCAFLWFIYFFIVIIIFDDFMFWFFQSCFFLFVANKISSNVFICIQFLKIIIHCKNIVWFSKKNSQFDVYVVVNYIQLIKYWIYFDWFCSTNNFLCVFSKFATFF